MDSPSTSKRNEYWIWSSINKIRTFVRRRTLVFVMLVACIIGLAIAHARVEDIDVHVFGLFLTPDNIRSKQTTPPYAIKVDEGLMTGNTHLEATGITNDTANERFPSKSKESCKPVQNFVFIKTGKTGGSTMACILYRYGMTHNLIAALDPYRRCLIQEDDQSKELIIAKYNCTGFPGYNYMASHIRYNRPAMDAVVKNAKYITILRSPYTHMKSSFYFSGLYRKYPNNSNPFRTYLESVEVNDTHEDKNLAEFTQTTRNGFCNRFRISSRKDDDKSIQTHIAQLGKELDLVMLTEYYDESLILLRKLMCWDFEDIVYHSCKVHTTAQARTTQRMKDIISKMTSRDLMLYNHFNKTFWQKVKNYDGNFEEDLERFRNIQKSVTEECDGEIGSDFCKRLKHDVTFYRILVFNEQMKWMC